MVLDEVLLLGAIVLLASVLAARLGARLGLPSLLIFLVLGMIVGQTAVPFNDAHVAHTLGLAALVLILGEGGFTTHWADIRSALPAAVLLATLGVGVSMALVAVFAVYALGLSLPLAVLLGAILAPTDSAAVFSVLRKVPLPARIRAVVEAESGFNDAPIVLLVTMSTQWALGRPPEGGVAGLVLIVLLQLVAGAGVGAAIGWIGVRVMRGIALPASGLYPLGALGWAVLAYGVGAMLQVSGFAAVYVAAVMLGNGQLPHRNATRSFAEGMGWIAQIGLFVMLGMLSNPQLVSVRAIVIGVVLGAFVTFVARPASVLACVVWFRTPWREQAFISWAGLRGAIPIIMATVPLAAGVPQANELFDVVLAFVIVFTLLQAPTLPLAARLLGVSSGDESITIEIEAAPLDKIQADLMQVRVPPGSRLHGVSIRELRLPKNAVVSLIIREEEPFTPGADDVIRTGDDLLIVTPSSQRPRVERRFRQVSLGGRLARWQDPDAGAAPDRRATS